MELKPEMLPIYREITKIVMNTIPKEKRSRES